MFGEAVGEKENETRGAIEKKGAESIEEVGTFNRVRTSGNGAD